MDDASIKKNMDANALANYQRVTYQVKYLRPPCAVVGGGPGLKYSLDVLRTWEGDIFGVNDTAAYLSKNGIACNLYSIDSTPVAYPTGILIKDAYLATRSDPSQFRPYSYDNIYTFDIAEDGFGGVQGGPTAVTRAPHLFLRMGYTGVVLFGCEACFSDLNETHVTGTQKVAYDNMLVIHADGHDFVTNASLFMQTQFLVDLINRHPQYIKNASGGLLAAMLADPDWDCVAIGEDLKAQYESKGVYIFSKPFDARERAIWQLQATS